MQKARSLEDAFFFQEDQRLLESLREMKALEATTGLLAEVSGITDPRVLLRLAQVGVTPSMAASLSILPLVAVAWADGAVDAVERRVLVESLDQAFFFQTIDKDILEAWLSFPPPADLLDAWEAFTRHLVFELEPRERVALAEELMGHAQRVAQAAGRLLGFGGTTPAERAVLDRIEKALGHG